MPDMCDILKSIKHVYRVSKFFAVLPYKIETSNGITKAVSCHYSFVFTVLTTLIIFAHGITFPFYVFGTEMPCFFCWLPASVRPSNNSSAIVTSYVYQAIVVKIINRLIITMMSFTALLFALFYSSRVPTFIHKLFDSDYYFRALLSHSEDVIKCCISGKIVTGLLLVSLPAILYYMYTDLSGPDTSLASVTLLIILMWDNMNSAVCEAQFINFTYLLTVRFKIVNNYLVGLKKLNREKSTRRNKRERKSTTEIKKLNNHLKHTPNIEEPQPVHLLSLEMCRRCHRYLCDLVDDLNGMYQTIFLSTLSGCFLKLLLIVFAMVVGTTSKHSSGTFEEILKRIFWITFYASRFFAVILFACQTVHEGIHTKTIVAEICSTVEDSEFKKELLLFYNQINNRNIEFSACSLFTLSTELITSAFGVGTTYLVILVQFHAPA